uniref:Purinergic receptor P2X 7 n=1 Tax=Equus caballus TaxID=9796 RepID=A0A9L0RKI7_HORSE
MPACCSWNDVFQYETNKVTRIQSMNYGTIKWICHLIVFSYVIFALVSDKRYQRKEPLISSVHTKVKGIAEVREEIIESGAKKVVQSVFDTADYTFPLQGNSFFVMTNFLKTEGQEQGLCPEYPTRRTLCSSDRGCKKGWMDPQSKGHGRACVPCMTRLCPQRTSCNECDSNSPLRAAPENLQELAPTGF